jgi:hypothetical protein
MKIKKQIKKIAHNAGKSMHYLFMRHEEISFIRDTSGLTLFEILVGVTVSSLILIMIYSSHRSITKAVYQLTGIADFYENTNLALRRIDKDISCVIFNKDNKNINFVGKSNYEFPFRGKLDLITVDHQELSMLSDPGRPYPKSDIKEAGYFLKQDNKIPDLFFLIRREESHYDSDIESGGENNIILENVIDIKFEFRKGNDWVNNWDSRENNIYPKFIKTTLKVRNYNKEEEDFVLISKIGIDK